jgi:cellobiose-specific phosphotransferase system component IIB
MTAITLNLLAEEQQAQQERARDPVKLFIAIGLAVLALVVAWGGMLSVILMQRQAELRALEAEWEKINAVGEKEGEFQGMNGHAEEIVALNHSRVLVAPQLAMVKDIIPSSIQLSQFNFVLTVETPVSDASGEEAGGGKRAPHPKPVERLMLLMVGTASSDRPEMEVDQFLRTLRHDEQFSAAVDDIQLRSISRSSGTHDKNGGTQLAANFTIECRYKELEKK